MSRKRPWEYLPKGEFFFKMYYTEMGQARSYTKICKWCVANGIINKRTGRGPVAMAIFFRMWRWALKHENQAEAYKLFNDAMRDEGEFVTPEKWKEFIDDKALTVFRFNPLEYKRYTEGKF